MPPSQTANALEVGPKLLESGCRQGSLIQAPARMVWIMRSEQGWTAAEDVVEGAQLVVVSQDCDINAPINSEPRIEAMTARWTSNANEIHAARKGNSARLFLLREDDAKGLVADARRRVQLDKAPLLGASFDPTLLDGRARMKFANWVAGRYNRPAIANELVDAIQKPIVSAVEELTKKHEEFLRVLDRIAELRFAVNDLDYPWTVHLVVMMDEGDELNTEEAAEIAGWLDSVLVKKGGPISTTSPLFRTEKNISLHDYLHTTHLQLDHFTPENL